MSRGDPIEDLLRTTGKRPDAPAARRERVRAAAREVWWAEAGARARRRRIVGMSAAGLAAAIAITVFAWLPGAPRPSGLTVSRAEGDAWAERGPWINRNADAVRTGLPVFEGATVTTDTHAKVALGDSLGRSIRLDGATALRVTSGHSFALERGAVYVDTGGFRGILRIATPFGVIEDVGTQFQARLDQDRLVVRVREGTVVLRGRGEPVTAVAGQSMVADGLKAAVTADAPEGWDWIEAAGAPMAIDGRSLREFVTWAARERGVRVRWADPALEARARSILLHGSIEGMTLDQATESVLATADIPHRWAPGEIVVGATP
jgi:ferric-dicitrate binding protein FerR (iron transport regulator)